jgi:RimJ/RimL family protein N-acetyltransferase
MLYFVSCRRDIDFCQLKNPYYVRYVTKDDEDDFKVDQMAFAAAKKYPEQAKRIFIYNKTAHQILIQNPNNLDEAENIPMRFDDFLEDCFLIFHKNKLIGYVQFYPCPNELEISCSYALLPRFQGRGLGTKLLANIKKYCAKNFSDKYRYISLYIKQDNIPSIKIAEKNGFKKQNKTPVFSREMSSYKFIIEILEK